MLCAQRSLRLGALCLALALLLSCPPAEAWYKPSTGPSYYSVGRASGLLSGIRRSPYIRRSEAEPDSAENSAASNFMSELGSPKPGAILKSMAVCVKDVAPNLQSCELLQDASNTFQCKAEVFLSLDSSDCVSA
ncbi:hypothetical protein NDU88_007121 [Pleurodeles waltl]|uniref:Neuropeptide B n=1 Tax=Pleurodeles waltl TaxID=8319 RepID=A0AAV7PKP8_PLEWA|nr:hypothetical protein NDU88_007121 [Pleurodeles waltl]